MDFYPELYYQNCTIPDAKTLCLVEFYPGEGRKERDTPVITQFLAAQAQP